MNGVAVTGDALEVIWHELECGDYRTDLPLWRELAQEARGPVLDVGAGTGRVALDLRRHGVEITALDLSPVLIARLRERAAAARFADLDTVVADATSFTIPDARFHLVLVPMQTIQLLDGPAARAGFLRCAHSVLAPGGLLVAALADATEAFEDDRTEPPLPDMRELDGVVYASHAVAIRDLGDRIAIDRLRQVVDGTGRRDVEANTVELHSLTPETLAREAAGHGFTAEAERLVPTTEEYVGSRVVVLRA